MELGTLLSRQIAGTDYKAKQTKKTTCKDQSDSPSHSLLLLPGQELGSNYHTDTHRQHKTRELKKQIPMLLQSAQLLPLISVPTHRSLRSSAV